MPARKLNVLIGCEESGIVRDAFRRLGHEAWSCDVEGVEPRGQWPNYHLFGDVRWFLNGTFAPWDLGIFYPPCDYQANSGSKHLYLGMKKENGREPERWAKLEKGCELFRDCLNAPIPHVAVENPIIHGHALALIGERPTQIIQPWQFGHGETKATCLWLRNLPKLHPTNIVEGREQRVWKMGPGKNRKRDRSETFVGIAEAMAAQWSAAILGEYDL